MIELHLPFRPDALFHCSQVGRLNAPPQSRFRNVVNGIVDVRPVDGTGIQQGARAFAGFLEVLQVPLAERSYAKPLLNLVIS